MRKNVQRAAGVATAAALAVGGGAEALAAPSASEMSLALTSRQPATSTGIDFRVLYRDPANPEGKPSPIEGLVIEAPDGLRFDGAAVPACDATDDELRAMGRDACPAGSKVGEGTLTAITGFDAADPVEADLTVFNGGDQLIELVTVKGSNTTAGWDRLTIDGSTLTAHPPNTPGGPPDGRTSIREIKFRIEPRESGTGADRRAFITTPPACPAERLWSSRLIVDFANGTKETLKSSTPCDARPRATPRPRLRVSVAPRSVRAGVRTRFNVRVRSGAASCRLGVGVRLGGGRAVTGADGETTVVATLRRPGLRRVRLSRPGCVVRSMSVRVRPR